MTDARHAELQRRYFEAADPERFRWTTEAQGFAETEDALLADVLARVVEPCLEIGCGEGNNLVRLLRQGRCFGVDLFPQKLHFAAANLPGARLAVADAAALPFRDGAFRSVFVRDLLHHVPRPPAVLAEAVRLLAPGGALLLLEPNGRNPLVRLQTWLVPAERGARASGAASLAALLEPLPLEDVELRMLEPLPLRRLFLHYRFGMPSLGRVAVARRGIAAAERLLGRVLPASRWSYVAIRARKR
ncbi:MAG: class I SAM-dependent methyltransferase [Deltaproteobacteria bacterium]|nr:MAG: class I SAM-dependent methyltransferase [Deltaproteobacteria bacterium]